MAQGMLPFVSLSPPPHSKSRADPLPSSSLLRAPVSHEQILVDTMTERRFSGNPTPIFILDDLPTWPSESALQQIAR